MKLDYSTYLGGNDLDHGRSVAAAGGEMVVAGDTSSTSFPTSSAFQPSYAGGGTDAFVSWFDSSGDLAFSTYLGGLANDEADAVGFRLGGIYLAGMTNSDDFPTINPYQAGRAGGFDAFVCLLDSSGGLTVSTYLGGTGTDYGNAAAWELGELVVAGSTSSLDFPTVEPFQAGFAGGSYDVFVSSFGSDGALQFSTYLGGQSNDYGYDVGVTGGEIWVAGSTFSLDFPTVSPVQGAHAGERDAFLCRFDTDRALGFSTYLGGSLSEYDTSLAVGADSAWITGFTASTDFPTEAAFQPAFAGGTYDAFVCRFDTGLNLSFSTYFGGTDSDSGSGIALEGFEASITGTTYSADFPTVAPVYPARSFFNSDAFAASFDSSGTPVFSTYLGGQMNDSGYGIARESGRLILTGFTSSSDFPTRNPYQGVFRGGGTDAFLTVFAPVTPSPTGTPAPTPTPEPTLIPVKTPTPEPTLLPVKTPTPEPTLIPVKTPTPPGSTPVPAVVGDYNGDGTSDIALFRPSAGLWLVRGLTRAYFGASTDFPVPRDYSGNGTWDIAVYRAAQSKWMARGVTTAWFGAAVDVPVPGDYDGDGTADLAVFRPSIGKWAVRGVTQAYYGVSSDHLVPGNYAGDPRTQIAVWRSSTGRWLVKGLTTLYYGGPTDGPVPGPYSGGLTWDYAVYRYDQGKWLVRGRTAVYYGNSTDTVQPADYDGDGTWDFAVFRSASGKWLIRGVSAPYYGASTDLPVTNP